MINWLSCLLGLLGLASFGFQLTLGQDQEVSFQIANRSHFEQIHKLLEEDFFPEEPLSRSSASSQSAYYWQWVWVRRALLRFQTVVALDQNGTVIGVNLGIDGLDTEGELDWETLTWGEQLWEYQIQWMWNWRNFLSSVSPYFGDNPVWAVYEKAVDILGFHGEKLVAELDCGRLYNLEVLCVSRTARIRGLGTELVRMGEEEARARGCQCGRVFATSKYSARIFRKLGWTETGKLRYEDFKNEEGQLYVLDSGEHSEMATFSKMLK